MKETHPLSTVLDHKIQGIALGVRERFGAAPTPTTHKGPDPEFEEKTFALRKRFRSLILRGRSAGRSNMGISGSLLTMALSALLFYGLATTHYTASPMGIMEWEKPLQWAVKSLAGSDTYALFIFKLLALCGFSASWIALCSIPVDSSRIAFWAWLPLGFSADLFYALANVSAYEASWQREIAQWERLCLLAVTLLASDWARAIWLFTLLAMCGFVASRPTDLAAADDPHGDGHTTASLCSTNVERNGWRVRIFFFLPAWFLLGCGLLFWAHPLNLEIQRNELYRKSHRMERPIGANRGAIRNDMA